MQLADVGSKWGEKTTPKTSFDLAAELPGIGVWHLLASLESLRYFLLVIEFLLLLRV